MLAWLGLCGIRCSPHSKSSSSYAGPKKKQLICLLLTTQEFLEKCWSSEKTACRHLFPFNGFLPLELLSFPIWYATLWCYINIYLTCYSLPVEIHYSSTAHGRDLGMNESLKYTSTQCHCKKAKWGKFNVAYQEIELENQIQIST